MSIRINPVCHDDRPCFARKNSRCYVLSDTYPPERCPFCKEFRDVTGGTTYQNKHVFERGRWRE